VRKASTLARSSLIKNSEVHYDARVQVGHLAVAGRLVTGAFDAEHVELSFDVTEDEMVISPLLATGRRGGVPSGLQRKSPASGRGLD